MPTLRIDTVVNDDQSTAAVIEDLTSDVPEDVRVLDVTEDGDGADWPTVTFEGSWPDLVVVAARYVGIDGDALVNLREVVSFIKE